MQIFLFPSQLGKTNALFGKEITILSTLKLAAATFLKTSAVRDHQCYTAQQRSFQGRLYLRGPARRRRETFLSCHNGVCVDVGGSGGTASTGWERLGTLLRYRAAPPP